LAINVSHTKRREFEELQVVLVPLRDMHVPIQPLGPQTTSNYKQN
jgi:hypothetical protein